MTIKMASALGARKHWGLVGAIFLYRAARILRAMAVRESQPYPPFFRSDCVSAGGGDDFDFFGIWATMT